MSRRNSNTSTSESESESEESIESSSSYYSSESDSEIETKKTRAKLSSSRKRNVSSIRAKSTRKKTTSKRRKPSHKKKAKSSTRKKTTSKKRSKSSYKKKTKSSSRSAGSSSSSNNGQSSKPIINFIKFKKLWDTKQDSNFTLDCKGTKFQVHTHVLSARSSTFDLILKNQFQQDKEASVVDVEPKILSAILEWIYTNEIVGLNTLNCKEYCELVKMADHYKLDQLRSIALGKICEQQLSSENISDVLRVTTFHEDDVPDGMDEKLLTFCQTNFPTLVSQSGFCENIHSHSIFSSLPPANRATIDKQVTDVKNKLQANPTATIKRKLNVNQPESGKKDKEDVKHTRKRGKNSDDEDVGSESESNDDDDDDDEDEEESEEESDSELLVN